jgi:hypothetical protein
MEIALIKFIHKWDKVPFECEIHVHWLSWRWSKYKINEKNKLDMRNERCYSKVIITSIHKIFSVNLRFSTYTVQYFDNFGSPLVISGRISLKHSRKHFLMPSTIWQKLIWKLKKTFYPLPVPPPPPPSPIGLLKQNLYLWVDFKDNVVFLFELRNEHEKSKIICNNTKVMLWS